MVERFNQTLLNMLGTLEDHQKEDWKSYVVSLVHSYNATRHDSTGYSPFFLMFDGHLRLAVEEPEVRSKNIMQQNWRNVSSLHIKLIRMKLDKGLTDIKDIMTRKLGKLLWMLVTGYWSDKQVSGGNIK